MILLLTLMLAHECWSQKVMLKINEGLDSKPTLQANVEREVSKLLTEFNAAARQHRQLNLNGINMSSEAKADLQEMYDFLPFSCDDPVYTERCIRTVSGYCIRGILVSIIPQEGYEDELERELTVNFDASSGQITGVVFSLPLHQANLILGNAKEVNDVARRNEILGFVENYRSYYDKKDIDMLEKVFSDDAIIISGTVKFQKRVELANMVKKEVEYKQQTKKEYLDHLRNNIFRNNKFIRVNFDNIEVARHPTRTDVYIVTLQQDWNSQRYNGRKYHDDGFVTLVWEFSDKGADPQILFRSWQASELLNGNKDELFKFDDFNIPPSR